MFIEKTGNNSSPIRLVWLHGWGQDHTALLPLSALFTNEAENYLLDLPGFGQSDPPQEVWGNIDYTKAVIAWLQHLPVKRTFIIGHSFGGRIAIQAAKELGPTLGGIILIAGAGLRKKRTLGFHIKAYSLKTAGKCLKFIDQHWHTSLKEAFSRNFGSRDYKATSGIMRNILVKTINDDLTTTATQIAIPTLLIYGTNDIETPIEFGQRYNKLIKSSQFFAIPGFDHYTILSLGRHQIYNLISQFLQVG